MKVIYRSVTSMNAHAHTGDVDRVPPYVCLECHRRERRWMGEGHFRRVVGAEKLSDVCVLWIDQAGDYQHGRDTDRAFEFQELHL